MIDEAAFGGTLQISVILCTYNRYQSLAKALDSVAASSLSSQIEWEVLVVDNNSSDQTREVVESVCSRYPGRFRYVFELQQGKSHALNAGIREASGDILAFMDDDVVVEPTWLRNLTAALEDVNWAGAGGRILLEQSFSPPRWLSLNGRYGMGGILALFDLGDVARELDQPPYGTNMAFRRSIFEKYGGFRIDLGPRPGSEIRGEDTEFGRRIMLAGERLRYEPSAVVHHAVPQSRRQKKYFLKWWFDLGRSAIREGPRPDVWHLGIPRTIAGSVPVMLRWMLALNPQRRFYCKTRIWLAAGQIAEVYRQRRLGFAKPTSLGNA
ncbi:MAG: glycosyltransferase [Bryobacteraceae bacterium]